MENAILKTLIYADIFDYPLTLREIHKWLVDKKVDLKQLDKALGKLNQKSKIKNKNKFYFLPGTEGIIKIRNQRIKQSKIYFRKARFVTIFFKLIPWIKLVGISGGLSMENAGKNDDIDLILVTAKDRLWLSRLLALGVLSMTGQRRKSSHTKKEAMGKVCLNILVEEDKLEQRQKNLYVAHEVLQMKPLWFRDGVYSRYLEANQWAFRFLPNWISGLRIQDLKLRSKKNNSTINLLEKLAKKFQLKIMQKPKGQERIEDGMLYFHPKDYGDFIISEYQKKLRRAGLT